MLAGQGVSGVGMMHRLIFAALALAPMFVHAQDKAAVQAAEVACGPKGVHLKARFIPEVHEIAQAAAGVAQVYVIDPAHWPRPISKSESMENGLGCCAEEAT